MRFWTGIRADYTAGQACDNSLRSSDFRRRVVICLSDRLKAVLDTNRSRRCRYGVQRLFARIRCGDDGAHGLLIEAFESTVTLEVFQMAADGAVAHELVALLPRDETGGEKPFGAFRAHGPALAFRKGLPQKLEIGERSHRVHALPLQLVAQRRKIEPRF